MSLFTWILNSNNMPVIVHGICEGVIMQMSLEFPSRRDFLTSSAAGLAYFTTAGLYAEQLMLTPSATEGPFYPDRLPLDTDNDLLIINDSITPAVGQVTHLSGRVLNRNGEPIKNAEVEIWQVDHHGVYLHSGSAGKAKADANFQGYGHFETDSTGAYYFRTIKPVAYPGRTPHIHFKVNLHGRNVLTSQLYIQGESQNQRDFLYKRLGSAANQKLVTIDFQPKPESETNELLAKCDIVIGRTPNDKS